MAAHMQTTRPCAVQGLPVVQLQRVPLCQVICPTCEPQLAHVHASVRPHVLHSNQAGSPVVQLHVAPLCQVLGQLLAGRAPPAQTAQGHSQRREGASEGSHPQAV